MVVSTPTFTLMDILWCRLCGTRPFPDLDAGIRVYRCPPTCTRRDPINADDIETLIRDVLAGMAPQLFRRHQHSEPHPADLLSRVTVGALIRRTELRLHWRA